MARRAEVRLVVYVRVVNTEDGADKTEVAVPRNALFCGQLHKYQKEQTPHHKMAAASAAAVPPSAVWSRIVTSVMLVVGALMFAS